MNRRTSHEAARAWRTLDGGLGHVDRVQMLRESRDTAVYRLQTAGGPIIAKRCPAATAAIERTVYECLLARLPLPRLHFYGVVTEPGEAFCWLFVEEAQGEPYRADRGTHRAVAARWLAALHGAIPEAARPASLPERQAEDYERLLHDVRGMLERHRNDEMSGGAERRSVLAALAAHCDRLSEHWSELAQACRVGPQTLVHGDIVAHNVCIRSTPAGAVFMPFDWEKAGWGTPAEDLSSVDLDVYRKLAAGRGLGLGHAELRRLAGAGKVFRCLVFLAWLEPDLGASPDRGLGQLRLCRSWLDSIVERAPWAA